MQMACEQFSNTDAIFNGANFSNAFRQIAGATCNLDGHVVAAILSGRSDVEVLKGGSHYRFLGYEQKTDATCEQAESTPVPARPVEPAVVSDPGSQGVKPSTKEPTQGQKLAERTMKAIWAANDAVNETPVIKEPLATESNCPKILDSSSEPMRAAFESSMAERYDWYQGYFSRNENRYFDSSVEMAWQAFQAGAKYQPSPLSPSPCMDGVNVDQFVDGIMEARGRTSDPVNPSHYKQGGIECIEAIKAATGDGFIGYVWGNVLKYLWRWPKKGGVDDLKKARWYLDRLIKEVGE
jgi:hypothetical protein